MTQPDLIQLPPPTSGTRGGVLTATGAELAEWLGISEAAVTQGRNAGFFVMAGAGKYDLKQSIQSYVKRLRGRRTKDSQTTDLKKALDFWDVENKKQKNLQWRMKYGQSLALALINQLSDTMNNIKAQLASIPGAEALFRRTIEDIGGVDMETLLMETEDMESSDVSELLEGRD